ncbi:MAG: amidohydrolase family protein [Acidobacteriota bacterium]
MKKKRLVGWAAALPLFGLAVTALQAERPWIYAITDVKIVQAPGQVIEKGTIVLRDGLVEAVGVNVQPPPDAQVIEGQEGWTVYPAFIDAAAKLALPSEEQPGGAAGGPPNIGQLIAQMAQPAKPRPGAPHELSKVRPEAAVVNQLDFSDSKIKRHRKLGFAVSHVIPPSGIVRGQSALIALRSGDPRQLVLRGRVAQVRALPTGSFFAREYPGSKMGAVAALRQALLDAQRQSEWERRYQANPVGMQRPEFRTSDESLIAVTRGQETVLFVALSTLDHGRFKTLAEEFGLNGMVLGMGCQELPYRLQASGMPVLLPLKFPKKPKVEEEDERRETGLKDMQAYLRAPKLPKQLAEAGVDFALVSSGMSATDFSKNLHKAVEAGLSHDQALAALTTVPARLLGISQVAGTLQAGRIANLMVVNGDLFAEKPDLRYLFVDGRHEEFEVKEQKGDPTAQVDPTGVWEVTVQVMGRDNESTWTIEGSPGDYSGYSEGQRGRRDFNSVELEGNALTIRTPSPMGGELEFTLIITGDTLEGEANIDTPQGSFTIQAKGKRVSGPEGGRR